jgi:membrane dipeptidase
MPTSFLFDAHLDLSLNAVEFNRDLTKPLAEIRAAESNLSDHKSRGRNTVSLPEMRKAGIGLCVATQLARVDHHAWSPIAAWRSPAQAWSMTQAQLAWYRCMEEAGEMVQLLDPAAVQAHIARWEQALALDDGSHESLPIGYVLSLEGADSLITIDHLHRAYEYGLRAIGPAHYGPGVYANGHDSSGKLNARGRELVREADKLGMILDVTHLCADAFWEAIDLFQGTLWASHHNCRTLVDDPRQLTDDQIRAVAARNGVIGNALDAWMVVPGWIRGTTLPQDSGATLAKAVDHIDHICQLTGTTRHCGLGSDLDGGFGTEQTPMDFDTIADMTRYGDLLKDRGYTEEDIRGIQQGNFLRVLMRAWGA